MNILALIPLLKQVSIWQFYPIRFSSPAPRSCIGYLEYGVLHYDSMYLEVAYRRFGGTYGLHLQD
jgi:hypothetical protein